MFSCRILFQYCQKNIIIQCQKNELLRNVITRYGTNAGLPIGELFFLYKGDILNQDLNVTQIKNKKKRNYNFCLSI